MSSTVESISSDDEYFDSIDWEEKLTMKNLSIRRLKQRIIDMEEENRRMHKDQEHELRGLRDSLQEKEEETVYLKRLLRKKEQTIDSLKRSDAYLRDGYEKKS